MIGKFFTQGSLSGSLKIMSYQFQDIIRKELIIVVIVVITGKNKNILPGFFKRTDIDSFFIFSKDTSEARKIYLFHFFDNIILSL